MPPMPVAECPVPKPFSPFLNTMIEQTVNTVGIFVMTIEAQLIPHRKKDQQTTSEAQSKADDVD